MFWIIRKIGGKLQVLFNLATYFNYSITSSVKIPVFGFFEKLNKGQLKMVNVKYWWPDLDKRTWNKFSVVSIDPKKMLEMFVIRHSSIWPNLILIVLRIKKKQQKNNNNNNNNKRHMCKFHYVAMAMVTAQILKSVDLTKTQNLDI